MAALSSQLPEALTRERAASVAAVLGALRVGFVSATAWTVASDWNMGGQPKPDCYLVTPTRGAIRFGWERLRTLHPGSLALAPTGAPLHGRLVRGQTQAELLVVHAQLETDWGPSLPALARDWVLRLPHPAATVAQLRHLVALWGQRPAAGAQLGDALLGSLLGEWLATGALRVQAPGEAYDPRIAAALRLLRADPGAELDVAALAAHAGLRPVRFRALFKQALGVGPARYRLQLRLDHAARRLRAGREPIGRIAAELGFADQAYFNQRFKRRFGTTPGAFRRRSAEL